MYGLLVTPASNKSMAPFLEYITWALGASFLDPAKPEDNRPLVFFNHLCSKPIIFTVLDVQMLLHIYTLMHMKREMGKVMTTRKTAKIVSSTGTKTFSIFSEADILYALIRKRTRASAINPLIFFSQRPSRS